MGADAERGLQEGESDGVVGHLGGVRSSCDGHVGWDRGGDDYRCEEGSR
jgi:hypothetical protein